MKFCKDCKYHKYHMYTHVCLHEASVVETSLVTGAKVHLSARDARMHPDGCRPTGRHFKPNLRVRLWNWLIGWV